MLLLQENIAKGQRVEKFELDYFKDGNWVKVTGGTTIGYKRILRFDPVTASLVRLRTISSRLNPFIASFGLYKQAIR